MTAAKSTASPRGQEGGILPAPPSTPTSEPAMCGEAVTGSEQSPGSGVTPAASLSSAAVETSRSPVPAIGDHVTVGKSDRVWRVSHFFGRRAYLESATSYQPYSIDRLTVIGQCQPRASLRERPDRCDICGCYRDVGTSAVGASE